MARIKEDRPITQRDDKGNFNVLIGEIVALFITIQGKARKDYGFTLGPERWTRLKWTVCENVLS